MDPEGFEPPTPGLKGQCSNQTELWILIVFFYSECEPQQLDRLLDSSKPAGGFD